MVRVSHWPCHYVVPRSSFDLFDVFIYVMYTSAHTSEAGGKKKKWRIHQIYIYTYTTQLVITTIVYIISSCLLCSMRHLHSQCCKVFGPSLDVQKKQKQQRGKVQKFVHKIIMRDTSCSSLSTRQLSLRLPGVVNAFLA